MAYPLQKTLAIAMLAFLLTGCQSASEPSPSIENTQTPSSFENSPSTSPFVSGIVLDDENTAYPTIVPTQTPFPTKAPAKNTPSSATVTPRSPVVSVTPTKNPNVPTPSLSTSPRISNTPTPVPPTPKPTPIPSIVSTPTPIPTPTPQSSLYKDGNASFPVSYNSPGGLDSFGITITIKNDTVTGLSINPNAADEESARYLSKFSSSVGGSVIGRKLNEISNLSRVAGASLTTNAFNAKIQEIRSYFQK